MSFSSFSSEFNANMFTSVENQFITKYLPSSDGDAVRVYLYGLYLCQCQEEFDAESCAKLLRLPLEKLVQIFEFWEECDLVRILSREPLFVQYLPVNAAIGKPKPIRAEKYAEFNRELYKQLQRAQKVFKPYEMQKILEFLENNPMEQQAFLLVSEYCAKKDGDRLSYMHILNKAKKLCDEHKYTYEQVECELADFNIHEREIIHIFDLLGIYRKPQDSDYEYLQKWSGFGMEEKAIYACAMFLKKGTLATLDQLVTELHEHDAHSEADAKEYLERRQTLADLVFKVARKLSVKIQNPAAYCDEYASKWLERGYEEDGLLAVASLCFKLRYGFAEMDSLLENLYSDGIVDNVGLTEYCTEREEQLKLLQKIQTEVGVVKKTQSALDMIETWRGWEFSGIMILEAAKRSANAAAPLSYMNKLLSEWKRANIFTKDALDKATAEKKPAATPTVERRTVTYQSEAAIAADKRSAREHYYAVLRQKAVEKAEQAKAKAQRDKRYVQVTASIKKSEIDLARAEVRDRKKVPEIKHLLSFMEKKRTDILETLGLTDSDFKPTYTCPKCSDTGFLPNGRMCNCYPDD